MTFELKGYDITYSRDNQTARIYNDGKSILEARFVGKMNIFEVVRTVAQFMVSKELITEDDISDVLRLCEPDSGERRAGARRNGDRAVPVS
jgi:hypothetical protein